MIAALNGLGRGDGRGSVVALGLGRWGGLPPPPEFHRLSVTLATSTEKLAELADSNLHSADISDSARYSVSVVDYE